MPGLKVFAARASESARPTLEGFVDEGSSKEDGVTAHLVILGGWRGCRQFPEEWRGRDIVEIEG